MALAAKDTVLGLVVLLLLPGLLLFAKPCASLEAWSFDVAAAGRSLSACVAPTAGCLGCSGKNFLGAVIELVLPVFDWLFWLALARLAFFAAAALCCFLCC